MPHRLTRETPDSIRAAPNRELPDGTLRFKLEDSDGQVVAGAPIEFHVGYGGGYFVADPVTRRKENRIEVSTDAFGVVAMPMFALGPRAGPNAVLVQSANAVLEEIVVGTYEATRLEIVDPAVGDRDGVSGQEVDVRIRAVDTAASNAGVPGLRIEVEVVSGGATFRPGGSSPGHYGILVTDEFGEIAFPLQLSRWAEGITLQFMPLWERSIPAAQLQIDARTPRLTTYSLLDLGEQPFASVTPPIRVEVSDSLDVLPSADDEEIQGLMSLAREATDRGEMFPPASCAYSRYKSFVLYPALPDAFNAIVWLPDYPDSPPLETRGRISEPHEGVIPGVHDPGPQGIDYVHAFGGVTRTQATNSASRCEERSVSTSDPMRPLQHRFKLPSASPPRSTSGS